MSPRAPRAEHGPTEPAASPKRSAASSAEPAPDLDEKLAQLPRTPGVYLLLDGRQKVIYVGKAKILRTRVRSYFRAEEDGRPLYPFLVSRVRDLRWVVTETEAEALILENNLIKEHRPRYNVKLTDDKTYLSLKITQNERFPRALLVRRVKKDGALYFGPYASARAIRDTLRILRRFFPLRTCTNAEFRQRTRPCIQHQIGRCGAPCTGEQDEESYAGGVRDAVSLLKGRTADLLGRLRSRMQEEAQGLRFENAARLRDQIRAVKRATERQLAQVHTRADTDVFGEHLDGHAYRIHGLFFREGRLVSSHTYPLTSKLTFEETLRAFVTQLYAEGRPLPDEILVPRAFPDQQLLADLLSERRGRRVRVHAPQRGAKRELVALAQRNARSAFQRDSERRDALRQTLEALQQSLALDRFPRCIECVDLSTFGGTDAVGALVSFVDGEPAKDRYRRYRIRSPEARGDTQMMEEVLRRRLGRSRAKKGAPPDLLLLDGGAAQLAVAERVIAGLQLGDRTDLAAIAKSRSASGRTLRAAGSTAPERVFRPGGEAPVVLPEASPAMLLLQRIRDEAHRFAIEYHRRVRGQRSFRSVLDGVAGVGPKRKQALVEHFGSLPALRAASVGDLAGCPLISPVQAEAIHAQLQDAEDDAPS